MSVIWIISFILVCLPLLMAAFFLTFTLPRKIVSVKQDLSKLTSQSEPSGDYGESESKPQALKQSRRPGSHQANQRPGGSRIASEDDIDALVNKFFSTYTLSLPALLLTLFYAAGFGLCDAFLSMHFNSGTPWFFSKPFVDASRPVLYAFIGVYLFNLGTIVRRIYLGDLNEQVFWGAINRLWLSMGLALVFLKVPVPQDGQSYIFFGIGFLANTFLDWVLAKSLEFLNRGKPKSEDLPLQMVKGINIWKEYRLEEEGIENVQNLATADVMELTVRTHYNFRTLIDWIDQALLLTRLSTEQVKILGGQATAISAIELAAASPRATGNTIVADALAKVLSVEPVLMGATLDRLYEDEYVQDLWNLWQSGQEGGALHVPSPAPAAPSLQPGAQALAAGAAAGAAGAGTPTNP
ncbi:MAG TPA: hypothetical protein VE133_17270 [Candidatus Sulfotelmatobacter sp.]|nr:hypothetical protein [Candidatus Sulfotelmatobacter sp.]